MKNYRHCGERERILALNTKLLNLKNFCCVFECAVMQINFLNNLRDEVIALSFFPNCKRFSVPFIAKVYGYFCKYYMLTGSQIESCVLIIN